MKQLHLLFVYNADNHLFSIITDFVHKIVSPQTYACSLCALTYGNFGIQQEWKNFLNTLPVEKIFLHKNEFQKQYSLTDDLPAIFYLEENKPVMLLRADEINNYGSLAALESALLQKIQYLQSLPV